MILVARQILHFIYEYMNPIGGHGKHYPAVSVHYAQDLELKTSLELAVCTVCFVCLC